MVKITSIFGSYGFLRIAWHDIFLLSDLSDHFPASWNLYTMYPAVILRSRRENAHLLVNPIPKLTMVLIWKTPPCLKFGRTSNRDVKNLPQRKLWARSIQPKFRRVRPGKEDHLKRWTSFSKLFRLDRTDPLSFGPKFPEILVEWIAPYESEQRTMHVLIRIWSHRTSGSVCFFGNDRSSHSRIQINLDPMSVYYEWASD